MDLLPKLMRIVLGGHVGTGLHPAGNHIGVQHQNAIAEPVRNLLWLIAGPVDRVPDSEHVQELSQSILD